MLRVFPSETTARSFITSFAKNSPGTAVFEDQFISWDTFKEQCCTVPSSLKSASFTDRLVFADKFSREEKGLSVTYYDKLSQDTAKALPYLKKALMNPESLSRNVIVNLKLTLDSYQEYLETNSLYEKEYLIPDFSKAPEDTIIYFASAIKDCDVEEAVKYCKAEEFTGNLPVLKVYKNTISEIRDTFRKVRALLKNKTRASDIAITVVKPQTCLAYIQEEAYKYNVDISFAKGKMLASFKSGSFFANLKNTVSESFSLESLKLLLLNRSYPFKDRELLSDVIRIGIDCKVDDGGIDAANWVFKLTKANADQALSFINDFTSLASEIVNASDAVHIQTGLRRFQDRFFEGASWDSTGDATEIAAFQRCMNVLEELENSAYRGNEPYSVFLQILENTIYVEQDKNQGIKVYEYPLSCGLQVANHFVIGLSDDNTRVGRTRTPFIYDDRDCLEVGDCIIKSYCYDAFGNNNLELSCAKTTYAGDVCVPALFLTSGGNIKQESAFKDEYWFEEAAFKVNPDGNRAVFNPTHLQVKNFEHALETTINLDRKNDFEFEDGSLKISATALSTWQKCPFRWALEYALGLKEKDYSVNMTDARDIGNILHNTYEQYLKDSRTFDKGQGNLSHLENLFIKEVDKVNSTQKGMDRVSTEFVKNKYKDILGKMFTGKDSAVFQGTEFVAKELYFHTDKGDYEAKGFIDCVLRTSDGDYVLLDFKKNSVDKESLQLVVYAQALENMEDIGKSPVIGAFYSIEGQRFVFSWKDGKTLEDLTADYKNILDQAIKQIKNKEFPTTVDSSNCEHCPYRRICRKRFVIK